MTQQHFHIRNRYIFFLDIGLVLVSILFSFAVRLDITQFYIDYLPTAIWMMLLALPIKLFIYYQFGLYRRYWAYASSPELRLIIYAATVASLLLAAGMYGLFAASVFEFFPRSVVVIDWFISLVLIGGMRFSVRTVADQRREARRPSQGARRVLILGAGDAGALVVRELQQNPQLNLIPFAFLDDDDEKQGMQIRDLTVVGTLDDLAAQLDMAPIDEVIFAIPSAPGAVLRAMAEVCLQAGVPFRTMPGIYELLGGKVSVSRLREVEITDLLRREPTPVEDHGVGFSLRDKRVMITGAGGSIASELCRQIVRWGPAELILVGHGENSIYSILMELENSFPNLPVQPIIVDIRDAERLTQIYKRHRPQVVFHAAAHKHVPLMEKNVEEAITNNIAGTRNVVQISAAQGIERLVMISTDKAVRPTSVMGATKRMAEMLVLDTARRADQHFSVVRFGNVLGSRGSVIPHFKRQIAQGGPVTVTHPDIERYFMTIPEAVHLVLQAFSLGNGGEVFFLNMGDPVRILDLARDLIRLSGLEPDEDIEIHFTGLRPGEKLYEELWDPGASYQQTEHPEIMRLDDEGLLTGEVLAEHVDELIKLAQAGEVESILAILDEIIPGAQIRSTPPPDLTSLV